MIKKMMKLIQDTLEALELGSATTFDNLTVFPLLSAQERSPGYMTLDEALERGCSEITEVSPGGVVSELLFVNNSDCPVLLLDGEALVGAKQDRVLNLSILAPAHKKIRIPVSCVEAGRWSARSERFKTATYTDHATGRAQRQKSVNVLLCDLGVPESDQHAVWAGVAEINSSMHASSPTSAMRAVYEHHDATLEEYVNAFVPEGKPAGKQVGAVFAVAGQIIGIDLFDAATTFRKLLPKLVRSYAISALRASTAYSQGSSQQETSRETVMAWMQKIAQANAAVYAALGEGEDVRLDAENLVGSALVVEGRVVHLSAFPVNTGT